MVPCMFHTQKAVVWKNTDELYYEILRQSEWGTDMDFIELFILMQNPHAF